MTVTELNQHWQIDLKCGFIAGTDRFFFQISVIDVYTIALLAYHIGLIATAKDALRVLKNALIARGLISSMAEKPVLRTDNGPQFTAHLFQDGCETLGIIHERIPIKSPNMNAYIESFHAILEDECYSQSEFIDFADVYQVISEYMD